MINDKIDPEKGKNWTPFVTAGDLLREAGDVTTAVKRLETARPQLDSQAKEALAVKLSDTLYTAFVLAEHYGIELEESFLQTVNDYMLKFMK